MAPITLLTLLLSFITASSVGSHGTLVSNASSPDVPTAAAATTSGGVYVFLDEHRHHGRRTHKRVCTDAPGVCKAVSDYHACCFNRQCKDLSGNPFHCGGCGHTCMQGMKCCGGQCTDVSKDERHCGKCWKVCEVGESCSFGMCGYG